MTYAVKVRKRVCNHTYLGRKARNTGVTSGLEKYAIKTMVILSVITELATPTLGKQAVPVTQDIPLYFSG